jgi:ATP-binding cassette subfamily B protein
MMHASELATGLRVRSSIPGRERWYVPAVRRNSALASRLTAALEADPRLRSVKVNVHTGGVLITFDRSVRLDVAALIAGALVSVPASERQPVASSSALVSSEPSPRARLLARVGANKRELRLATAAPILAATGAFLPNLAFASVTNTARNNGSALLTSLGITSVRNQLFLLGSTVVGAFAIDILAEFRSKQRWLDIAADLEKRIKITAFDHIQRLDMAYIDEQSTGKLLSIIVEDAKAVREFYESGYTDIVKKMTSVAIINALLFAVSPWLGLVANVSFPLIAGASRYFNPRTAAAYREAGAAQGEFSKALTDNLAGIPTIKSFTNEELEVARLSDLDNEVTSGNRRAFRARQGHAGTMRGLFYVSWATSVTQASYLLTVGGLSRNLYAVVLFAVPQLIASMFGIDETINLHRRSNSAAERILEILDVQTEVIDGGAQLTERSHGHVRFEQVEFAYNDEEQVLDGLDLDFSPGITAIVGGSGSGKSTIAKLLLRFYDVGCGRVTLDGRDIRELTLRSLRKQIAYVGQDPYLFPGTIEDNIRFGRPDATLDEIRHVAELAHISEFIESLPNGYQTRIGERGTRLSGGQRQRVCIARALLKDAPILILDEASASLDNNTEQALQRSLATLAARGRTIIFIAHRLASVRHADRIAVLEHGRVRESGTHEQLLMSGGLYASLWRVQATHAARSQTSRSRSG